MTSVRIFASRSARKWITSLRLITPITRSSWTTGKLFTIVARSRSIASSRPSSLCTLTTRRAITSATLRGPALADTLIGRDCTRSSRSIASCIRSASLTTPTRRPRRSTTGRAVILCSSSSWSASPTGVSPSTVIAGVLIRLRISIAVHLIRLACCHCTPYAVPGAGPKVLA
jgi:hypothetical protein